MDAHTGEHPRIGAVDVIPFVPLGGDDDGRLRRARPRLRRADRDALRAAGLPLRRTRRRGPSGSSWPTSGAASTRGSSDEIGQPGRDARLRPVAAPPVGRRRRRRRAAVPHRLQHQPRLDATSSWPSGSPGASANRAAGCPKVQANGFWIEELGSRPGLDEPPRLRDHAALAGLGDRPRRRRRGRRRASPSRS